ncbi:MAG: zinc-binding alcohol dehydrogenase [Alphaproteobacteria bacterium]|nr:zinc-binding alcohol dehydrogenase [Alphaproteobacteria bacterium]
MAEARAFWTLAAGRGEIRAERLPAPGPGEVLVAARRSAISRGTETLVLRGEVPESEWARMRCPHQGGDFPFPVKYGYASVGVVEAGPPARLGQRVFCLHPHQDRYVVAADAVVPVPAAVSDDRACLAANMETAVNALWDVPPLIGDRITVVGAGVLGLLYASLARRVPGAKVEVVDLDPARRALVEAMGCTFAEPQAAAGERDLVVEASGAPAALATALDLAAFEATVVALSWYGAQAAPIPLGGAFHSRRLRLVSSQVGSVAPLARTRRTRGERLALALSLLADQAYDTLIGAVVPFAALPATLAHLSQGGGGAATLVAYP